MTVSNVSSATNPYVAALQAGYQQRAQDFKSLASALQSGDLNSAQSAFAAFQKDLQSGQNSQSGPFGANSLANQDFQTLQSSLQSGDLSAAQKAFASLKQDLQSTQQTQGHHHHHHHKSVQADNDGDSDDGGTSSSTSTSEASESSALDTQA